MGALPKITQPGRVTEVGLLAPRPLLTVLGCIAFQCFQGEGRAVVSLKTSTGSDHTISQRAVRELLPLCPRALPRVLTLACCGPYAPPVTLGFGSPVSYVSVFSGHFGLFTSQAQLYRLLVSWQNIDQDNILSDRCQKGWGKDDQVHLEVKVIYLGNGRLVLNNEDGGGIRIRTRHIPFPLGAYCLVTFKLFPSCLSIRKKSSVHSE